MHPHYTALASNTQKPTPSIYCEHDDRHVFGKSLYTQIATTSDGPRSNSSKRTLSRASIFRPSGCALLGFWLMVVVCENRIAVRLAEKKFPKKALREKRLLNRRVLGARSGLMSSDGIFAYSKSLYTYIRT